MSANFLEELAAQWYEYSGYFIRRSVRVGKRDKGGHDGELDVVAFHPVRGSLIHLEATMDADSWPKRERIFEHKFRIGDEFIPTIFPGLSMPEHIEKIILLGYGSNKNHPVLGLAKVVTLADFLTSILNALQSTSMAHSSVPENYNLIRCLQAVSDARQSIFGISRHD